MKLEIKTADNGYILKEDPGFEERPLTIVFTKLIDLLRHLNSELRADSRHSAKRIYVIEAPGDKHSSFTEEHGNVIWGKSE